MSIIIAAVVAVLAVSLLAYTRQPKFGRAPGSAEFSSLAQSPSFADGRFHNPIERPVLEDRDGMIVALWKYLFNKKERLIPDTAVPSIKTDLKGLDRQLDLVIWLGHSSYFIQLAGRTILIDPVFSEYAAPVSFANRAFAGSNPYTAEDMPDLDYLLITHDHWDHLDYPTVVALRSKIKNIIVPLGVGSHFEHWGFPREMINEGDWHSRFQSPGLDIHVLPAQHFSGRLLTRDRTLWAAFALVTPERKLFFSGDSGYSPHFSEIGQKFGGFDLAALDSGQYDRKWPYVHMNPEEAAQAAVDLRARAFTPAHVGKFSIANHTWDDPFIRSLAATQNKSYRLLTPVIGQIIDLADNELTFPRWWEGVK